VTSSPRLVLLNGAPGVGKSTLARALVDERPLALLLDLDRLRADLGQWRSQGREAKLAARRLGVALAVVHLRSRHDVVVPQLLGVPDFVVALADAAASAGARFVEVLLRVPPEVALQRFVDRRASLRAEGVDHPEAELADADVPEAIRTTIESLDRLAKSRRGTIVIDASGPPADTLARLRPAVW
jgi:predicted kinase